MQAIQFSRHGRPAEVLEVRDIPVPQPKRGQVLVRMSMSPVNPSDLLYIEGRYSKSPPGFPATPGFEGVGVVEANGGGLLGRFRKGKRVAVLNDAVGNWGEYTVTSARQVIPVPDDISDEQAATFFVNPATAIALTRHVLEIPSGAWLLQSAAGGALGQMIIRLGKKQGFRTINVVRRREQIAELKQIGADEVICELDGPIDEQVRKITSQGVSYAIDPVGGSTGTQVVRSLAAGGRCVLFGLLSGEPIQVDPRFLVTGSKRIEGFWLGDWAKRQRIVTMLSLFREIRSLMRDKIIDSKIAAVYTMGQFRDAVAHASQPGKSGKVLLRLK